MTTKTDEQLRAEFEAWYQHQPSRNAGELLTDDGILALVRSYDPKFDSDPEGPTESYVIGLVRAALAQKQREKHDTTLFCDLKTDEEKSAFFLSGRGYETGVIAQAIQNDVAMAYHRCAEYKKELEALQSQDREDAEWMTCESRRPWVTNSLKQRAQELRAAEKRNRNAFNKDYMGEPARYFADACGEAAAVFEAKLIAINHARHIEG